MVNGQTFQVNITYGEKHRGTLIMKYNTLIYILSPKQLSRAHLLTLPSSWSMGGDHSTYKLVYGRRPPGKTSLIQCCKP